MSTLVVYGMEETQTAKPAICATRCIKDIEAADIERRVCAKPALAVRQTVADLLLYQVTAKERHDSEPCGTGESDKE